MPDFSSYAASSILSPASGYIGAYDYTLTPYRGCSFACAYCYVPTIFYHRRLAATWGALVAAKRNAPELLLAAAKRGEVAGKRIFCSPNTDPYLPQERRLGLMRRLLEIFCEYPPALLMIQTRSTLVTRDLDLFQALGPRVVVGVSITTDREEVRARFERRCAPIAPRVKTLARLHAGGVRTQASLAPLLPCDPYALAELVDDHSDWVVAQPLKMGAGARTWEPAREIVREHGWEGWLEGGREAGQALAALEAYFGPRYHESQEGFSLGWL
jgi:DNA repair photolyase